MSLVCVLTDAPPSPRAVRWKESASGLALAIQGATVRVAAVPGPRSLLSRPKVSYAASPVEAGAKVWRLEV